MKTFVAILVLFSALIVTPSFAGSKPTESVTVLSTKRYIFYFKVDKSLVGATIEVWNGETLVQSDKAVTTKNIVDFFNLKAGMYTIKVKKGSQEFVFEYENKE